MLAVIRTPPALTALGSHTSEPDLQPRRTKVPVPVSGSIPIPIRQAGRDGGNPQRLLAPSNSGATARSPLCRRLAAQARRTMAEGFFRGALFVARRLPDRILAPTAYGLTLVGISAARVAAMAATRRDELEPPCGADALCEVLVSRGIDFVWEYPGGAIFELLDALVEGSDIRLIKPGDEHAAGHMNHVYARLSGRTGVCIVTSGPATTNLVTALETARREAVPTVFIVGTVNSTALGTGAFQEVNAEGVARPVTNHTALVTHPNEVAPTVTEAFRVAEETKGPVLVAITKDAQRNPIDPLRPTTERIETLVTHPNEPSQSQSLSDLGPDARVDDPERWDAIQRLCDFLPSDAVVVADCLSAIVPIDVTPGPQAAAPQPRDSEQSVPVLPDLYDGSPTLVLPNGFGTTAGFAVPGALGARMARPDSEVWAVVDSTSLLATMAEMATSAIEELPVKILFINRGEAAVHPDRSRADVVVYQKMVTQGFGATVRSYAGRTTQPWSYLRATKATLDHVLAEAHERSGSVFVELRVGLDP